jgi:hypothetical protein
VVLDGTASLAAKRGGNVSHRHLRAFMEAVEPLELVLMLDCDVGVLGFRAGPSLPGLSSSSQ